MINSFCVPLLVLINAFINLTPAHSYSQSYGGNAGQRYPDSSGSYVTNFGNGNNKHNFLKIDETSDRTSISGTSFSHDNSGRPAVENINVDIDNPNYRGEPPNINRNPKPSRTHVTNIGNGVGNKNLFVFNDRGHDQAIPRSNQDGNEGYRGEPYNGNQGHSRVITNIGRGPDNDNQIYVNGKRVYPNAVNRNGVQDTSVIRESLPSANSDGQIQQSQGGVPNDNFDKPNGVTRLNGPGYEAPAFKRYPNNNYNTHNYNQVKIINSNFADDYNDPSLKELPMRALITTPTMYTFKRTSSNTKYN